MSSVAYHLDDHRRLTRGAGMLTLVENRPRAASSLAAALTTEDQTEDTGWLDPLDRLTCRVHRRWIHECAHGNLHVIPVTGHRWCRPCRYALEIAVDELTGRVTLHCPRCDRGPTTKADHQLIAACEASLIAARTSRPAAALAA